MVEILDSHKNNKTWYASGRIIPV